MFAGLKNKIKEETGNDVNLMTSIVNSNQPKLLGKGRHSRQGSTTSLGSFTIDGSREECSSIASLDIKLADGKAITPKEFKKLESKEEEWRKKLQKKEDELLTQLKKSEEAWKSQLDTREKEWRKALEKKEAEKKKLQDEQNELQKKVIELEQSAKKAADYQRKVFQYQDDIDQLEGYQTQEMAKIKHLLLGKEQELSAKEKVMKETNAQLEALRSEMARLRKFEEEYENAQDDLESMRHNFNVEKASLASALAQRDEDVRHLRDRVAVLKQRSSSECVGLGGELTVDERVQALLEERKLLETRLEEAHLHLSEIKSSWSGKITSLETQVGRLCRQASEESAERRQAEMDRSLLNARITELEEELEKAVTRSEAKDARMERLKREKQEVDEELVAARARLSEDAARLERAIESATHNTRDLEERLQREATASSEATSSCGKLTAALDTERARVASLEADMAEMRRALEAEKEFTKEVKRALEREQRDKDEMMMRNAQVSQEVELARRELREQGLEAAELQARVAAAERQLLDREKEADRMNEEKAALSVKVKELDSFESEKQQLTSVEQELRATIAHMEGELQEKTKTNKMLQQRLVDMKRTLQRELKVPGTAIDPGGHGGPGGRDGALAAPSSSAAAPVAPTASWPQRQPAPDGDDVNFKYLKHVLIKFLTSREYEAQHLTRAVATLLRFSAEEERLLKETLEWKMSWFGTRPNLGNGQTAKTIPPR